MKRIYLLALLLFMAAALPSCRKEAPELINPNETRLTTYPSQMFTTFWHGMNYSYGFWDLDPTDWDRVYDEYLPRFEEMDEAFEGIDNPDSDEGAEFFAEMEELFTEVCRNLIDHHLSITFYKGTEYKFSIYPGYIDAESRDYTHDRMVNEYLMGPINANGEAGRIKDLKLGIYDVEGDDDNMTVISYRIDDVAYIFFTGFRFYGVLNKDPEGSVAQALRNYQRMILDEPDIKGVIIDVRENGGGYLADMKHIVGPMIDSDLLVGYTRTKEGLGRFDYGPWVPCIISPAEEHRKVEVPVVVLANLYSVSMSEMTCMTVRQLPNGCIVGERTFGGTGPLTGDFPPSYSGAWETSLISVYGSTCVMKDAQGEIHEGIGIVPDIEVLQTPKVEEAMRNGVDMQLERALEYIRTGK